MPDNQWKSMKINEKHMNLDATSSIITCVSINSPSPSCHKSLRVGFLLDTTAASRLPGANTTTQWTRPSRFLPAELEFSTQVLLQVHPAFHHPLGVFTWKSVKKPQSRNPRISLTVLPVILRSYLLKKFEKLTAPENDLVSFDWPGVHRITRCAIINTLVT